MNIKTMKSVNELKLRVRTLRKTGPILLIIKTLLFQYCFLPFYKAFLIETCADYNIFHALSNTVETMEKFLLITEMNIKTMEIG